MSNEIETHRVQRFTDGITLLAQQEMSRIRSRCRVETGIKAKIDFFDQIGATTMVKKTTRHSDTPLIEIPHRRRAVVLNFYHTSDLIDEADRDQVLNEPAGTYGKTMAAAAGRAMDQECLDNIFADSRTGEDGLSTTALPSTHKVAHAGAGLTLDKMLDARQILRESEVDRSSPWHALTKEAQITNLLKITEVTSQDYAVVKALVNGEINSYLNFNFEQLELINDDGSSHDLCPFYSQNSLLLAIGLDIKGRVTEESTKDFSTQVYYSMRVGATRMDETGVVQVSCLNA
jgi:hypothetical protein